MGGTPGLSSADPFGDTGRAIEYVYAAINQIGQTTLRKVTLVELKDIQLPESMKRAMAKQAEAGREKWRSASTRTPPSSSPRR